MPGQTDANNDANQIICAHCPVRRMPDVTTHNGNTDQVICTQKRDYQPTMLTRLERITSQRESNKITIGYSNQCTYRRIQNDDSLMAAAPLHKPTLTSPTTCGARHEQPHAARARRPTSCLVVGGRGLAPAHPPPPPFVWPSTGVGHSRHAAQSLQKERSHHCDADRTHKNWMLLAPQSSTPKP